MCNKQIRGKKRERFFKKNEKDTLGFLRLFGKLNSGLLGEAATVFVPSRVHFLQESISDCRKQQALHESMNEWRGVRLARLNAY